jgi:hypothetical protein
VSPRLRTFAQALTLLTLVASACFAAQAALPLPGRGNLIAAQALQQLSPFRRVSAVHRIVGNTVTVSASCASHRLIRNSSAAGTVGPGLRAWMEGRGSPYALAAKALPPRLKFKLASCPLALRAWVGAELERAHPVAIVNVRYAGTPAYRLTFLTRPLLVVYVDRQTLRLVAVNVRVQRWPGFSDVRFGRFD